METQHDTLGRLSAEDEQLMARTSMEVRNACANKDIVSLVQKECWLRFCSEDKEWKRVVARHEYESKYHSKGLLGVDQSIGNNVNLDFHSQDTFSPFVFSLLLLLNLAYFYLTTIVFYPRQEWINERRFVHEKDCHAQAILTLGSFDWKLHARALRGRLDWWIFIQCLHIAKGYLVYGILCLLE